MGWTCLLVRMESWKQQDGLLVHLSQTYRGNTINLHSNLQYNLKERHHGAVYDMLWTPFEGDSVQIGCIVVVLGELWSHSVTQERPDFPNTFNCGSVHDHDLRRGLVLAETTEEEDVCVLGRRAGGTWSEVITMRWRNSMRLRVLHASRSQPACTADDEGGSETARHVTVRFLWVVWVSSAIKVMTHPGSYAHFQPNAGENGAREHAVKGEKLGTTGKHPPISFLDVCLQWKVKREIAGKDWAIKALNKHCRAQRKSTLKWRLYLSNTLLV